MRRHLRNRRRATDATNHTEYETEARLLNKLEQPDGSAYRFTYDTNDATSTSFSGAIRSMVLPTGGRVEWDYATYSFQSQAMTVRESTITQQRGIGARRTYLDPATTTVHGSWTYDYTPGYEGPPGPFHIACFHRMRVSDNISQQLTDSYFATAGGRDMWWYGLPYAPCDPGTTGSSPVPWSVEPQGTYSTQLTFRGDRLKSRQVQVATSSGGTESVFATESYDHLGRLEAVCDGATAEWDGASACSGQLTLYSYNPDDRLIHVCQNVQGSSCGQQRSFSWDGRGFLIAESHPEIGASGNGTITYQRDARGNTTYRDIQNDSGDRPLAFSYDRAGRPILIEEQVSTGWRPLKEFFYARDNRPGSSEKRRGQLVMAKRTNWLKVLEPLPPPLIEGTIPVVVTDHYEYFGLGGRASKKTTSISLPSGNQSWTTEFAYDELGNIAGIHYPRGDWPYQTAPARQVAYNRRLGFLTGIPGYADTLNYQLGGMLREIDYANGVSWRQTAEAATGWERPDQIETLNSADQVLWSTGDYAYDGAGNISRIGNRAYVYDKFSRLKSALIDFQGTPEQAATFDAYGNLIALANNGTTRPLTASPATNRLTTPDSAYTSNGELAAATIDGLEFKYAYDGLGQQLFEQTTSKTWVYAYDASDDRVLSWECALDRCVTGTNYERYTLRGLGGEVLRVFEGPKRALLAWKEDFVYRDGKPLAWVKPDPAGEKTFFLHPDHLGSTRQVTNSAGSQVERHDYLPFGEESTATATGDVKLKFTGHERDQHGKPMDYMKARMCSPVLGRFLAPDPVMQAKRAMLMPQQWNRYTYVSNSPLKYLDSDGRELRIAFAFDSTYSEKAQTQIMLGVRHDFVNAGVRNVEILTPGSNRFGFFENLLNKTKTIEIGFTHRDLGSGGEGKVYGFTDGGAAVVSNFHAPKDDLRGMITFSINIGGHEGGHASGALPEYAYDFLPPGSAVTGKKAQPGSLMETGVEVEELIKRTRDFSVEDSAKLRQVLNLDSGGQR